VIRALLLILLGPTTVVRHVDLHVVQGFQLSPVQPFFLPKQQRASFFASTTTKMLPDWFSIFNNNKKRNNNKNNNPLAQASHQHRRLDSRSILYDSEVSRNDAATRDVVDMSSSLTQTISLDNNGSSAANHTGTTTTTTDASSNSDDDNHDDYVSLQQQQQQHPKIASLILLGLENDSILETESDDDGDDDDVPMPTQNGGFTHTKASRAKISAANKGNTPWNKGQHRSDERIAAGVRAANRRRFLQKLQELNMTEAQYEAEQVARLRNVQADRQARRTARGGFRPTEETKRKISRVLKAKYANVTFRQEHMQRRRQQQQQQQMMSMSSWSSSSGSEGSMSSSYSNSNHRVVANVRRGFTHSEETKRKISLSLRDRWANDEVYRQNMKLKCISANNRPETKLRISQALRNKWQNDVEFRNVMTTKFQNRSSNNSTAARRTTTRQQQSQQQSQQYSLTHREKISAAMKAKWQDEAYRQKALAGIQAKKQKRRQESGQSTATLMTAAASTTTLVGTSPTMTLTRPDGVVKQKVAATSAQEIRQVVRLVEPRTTMESSPPKRTKRPQTTRVVAKKNKSVSTSTLLSSSSKNVAVAPFVRMATSPAALTSGESSLSPLSARVAAKNVEALNAIAKSDDIRRMKGDDDETMDADDEVDGAAALKSRGRKKTTGSVSQLRKERRDLYDLLYGDDEDDEYNPQHDDDDTENYKKNNDTRNESSRSGNDDSRMHQLQQQDQSRQGGRKRRQRPQNNNFDAQELQRRNGYNNNGVNDNDQSKRKFTSIDFGLGDENLDEFDPYGLDDF
jgi:NUMOD3 motif